MTSSEERDHKGEKRYEADPRVLGQILAAQNIDFVLPDTMHIAEFFAQVLINIPGVDACRVCLQGVAARQGEMENQICENCSSFRMNTVGQDALLTFLPDFDFKCELGEQAEMQSALVASLNHPFGFFVFRVNDVGKFNIYKPFIKNLANYVALSLENRLQKDLLQRSQAELEHKVEERTRDLKATNLRLQEEVETRRQTEESLRQREAQLRLQWTALEAAANSMLITDSTGKIIWANPAFAHLTGYSVDEVIGRDPSILKSGKQESSFYKQIWDTILAGRAWHGEITNRHKDGHLFVEEMTITPVRGNGEEISHFVAIKQDITERKRHELEREAIATVSAVLRHATTRMEILNVIMDQSLDLFNADGVGLVLIDPQNGSQTDRMGRGPVGERMTSLNVPDGKGVVNTVVTSRQPYLNNHADQDPLFYRPDLLGDSHCMLCVPLIVQEQVVGALWIASSIEFMKADVHLLTAVADIAANAIHRVTLYEQTRLQLRHLIALHQIDLAISANFDLNVTLDIALRNVKDELEVDAADILLFDPSAQILGYASGIGFRTHRIEQSRVNLSDDCAGRAARERHTVSCMDLAQGHTTFSRALLLAEEGFSLHFATPLITKGQVKGVLEVFHRTLMEIETEWLEYFETLATQVAIALENASLFENLQRSNTELTQAYDATIEGWSRALDLRDRETEGHTQRVTQMALQLAEKMEMSETEKIDIRRGSLLHDIGKMGVPDTILLKPGVLMGNEWEVMRQHPVYAYQMLSPIKYLRRALEIPYYHHERWDGSGYPFGLKGEHIPLSARMFAVVDVFDALTSDRPYRLAWSHEDAYRYIEEQAGRYFDPQIVQVFLESRQYL